MSNKIKYQGRIYILESEVDEAIKEKVIEKAEKAIDEVFAEGGNGTEEVTMENNEDGISPEPTDAPEGEMVDPKVEEAIAAVEGILGFALDETGKMLLNTTISDILATSQAPVGEPVAPGEGNVAMETGAPDLVLHEGRVFRKIGKVEDYMKKPLKESSEKPTPKAIKVGGQVFVLAESQDLGSLTRKK